MYLIMWSVVHEEVISIFIFHSSRSCVERLYSADVWLNFFLPLVFWTISGCSRESLNCLIANFCLLLLARIEVDRKFARDMIEIRRKRMVIVIG